MKPLFLLAFCVAVCVGCGGGGNHEQSAGPIAPAAITSVCGGVVGSVPKVCHVEVSKHNNGSSGFAVVTFDAADLEGDIDFLCINISSMVLGVILPITCGTVVLAEKGPFNGTIIAEPIRVRLVGPQANWAIELGVEDRQGHLSNTATGHFECCGHIPCYRSVGPCVFADECCGKRCTAGVCT